MKNIWTIRS